MEIREIASMLRMCQKMRREEMEKVENRIVESSAVGRSDAGRANKVNEDDDCRRCFVCVEMCFWHRFFLLCSAFCANRC